jgi:hypothetical protein
MMRQINLTPTWLAESTGGRYARLFGPIAGAHGRIASIDVDRTRRRAP